MLFQSVWMWVLPLPVPYLALFGRAALAAMALEAVAQNGAGGDAMASAVRVCNLEG